MEQDNVLFNHNHGESPAASVKRHLSRSKVVSLLSFYIFFIYLINIFSVSFGRENGRFPGEIRYLEKY